LADMWTVPHLELENLSRTERNIAVLKRAEEFDSLRFFRGLRGRQA